MRITYYFILLLVLAAGKLSAQVVYTINADSTKLTGCDSNELIIENHTQNVSGFLFNTGKGRTIFKKALVILNDSAAVIGSDTIYTFWKGNGGNIYNTNKGNVGIHRTAPKVMLDLPGSVSVDDSSSFRIGYHPILKTGGLSGGAYTNLLVGDSAGYNLDGSTLNTFIGALSGAHDAGSQAVFVGYQAGYNNNGGWNTFVGCFAGQNNGTRLVANDKNTFIGNSSGAFNVGSLNSFSGFCAGRSNHGQENTLAGYFSGFACVGDTNSFYGGQSGYASHGSGNAFFGAAAGSGNTGDLNVLLGMYSGYRNVGRNNVFVGSYTGLADSNYPYGNIQKVTLLGDSADVGTSLTILNATALGSRAVVKASNTMVFGDTAVNSWLFNTNAVAGSGKALIVGSNSGNGNGAYLTTGGVWTNASDRWKKENFQLLDKSRLLEDIKRLPITRWNYIGSSEQHIGPVAQDFFNLFHLGNDDKTISTIDPSGVALAGIQELYDKVQQQEVQLKEQRDELKALKDEVAALKKMILYRAGK